MDQALSSLNTNIKITDCLVIDNFYSPKEQKDIWEELDYHLDSFYLDKKGCAQDGDIPLANLSRIYLDEIYRNNRADSNILTHYSKILSKRNLEKYAEITPSGRTLEVTNIDWSQVSYYEDGNNYAEHFDQFMHSCLIWFFREPKKFTGGNLTFTETGEVVTCKHNRMLLFPSYLMHKVDTVNMVEKDLGQGLGRYCLTHFFSRK